MNQALTDLSMLSHGSTQSWNSTGKGGDRRFPPGEAQPPQDYFFAAYCKAKTIAEAEVVLAEAHEYIKQFKERST